MIIKFREILFWFEGERGGPDVGISTPFATSSNKGRKIQPEDHMGHFPDVFQLANSFVTVLVRPELHLAAFMISNWPELPNEL